MKLVQIRCPNCGGELKVNPEKEKLVCGYCHTEFLVDDEVKRVETHHTYTDEAKVKKIELEKEIELNKYKIEAEKIKNKRIILTIMIVISIVLGLIGIVKWNDELTGMTMFAIIGWIWIFYYIIKNNKND